MVGYQHGYGLAAHSCGRSRDERSTARVGSSSWSAVKNDLALIAGAVATVPGLRTRTSASGKPSAANLQLALDMGEYVNSFSWRGDPAR